MSNFAFLPSEFRTIAAAAVKAEGHIMGDPRAACFHARFALEAAVHWLYRHDASLRMPYDNQLGALIHEPSFQNLLPEAVFQKARAILKIGNQAVHSQRPIRQLEALQGVKELHHLLLADPNLHAQRFTGRCRMERPACPSCSLQSRGHSA